MKRTNIFDKLDNVLGNYTEGKASENDVIKVAQSVNKYLLEHPHPHDIIRKDSSGVVNNDDMHYDNRITEERKSEIKALIKERQSQYPDEKIIQVLTNLNRAHEITFEECGVFIDWIA